MSVAFITRGQHLAQCWAQNRCPHSTNLCFWSLSSGESKRRVGIGTSNLRPASACWYSRFIVCIPPQVHGMSQAINFPSVHTYLVSPITGMKEEVQKLNLVFPKSCTAPTHHQVLDGLLVFSGFPHPMHLNFSILRMLKEVKMHICPMNMFCSVVRDKIGRH